MNVKKKKNISTMYVEKIHKCEVTTKRGDESSLKDSSHSYANHSAVTLQLLTVFPAMHHELSLDCVSGLLAVI